MKKHVRRNIKRVIVSFAIALLFISSIMIYANWKIPKDVNNKTYDTISNIPKQNTALVLGASKHLRNGTPNPYFEYRIQAAKDLFDAGKVKAFVLSGDNSREDYNEPQDMHDALVSAGIPDSIIYLDYAGFRTLDSVVRMKEIFGQNSFIIISQKFHNERAIFLAQHYGLTAYGYNAKDVSSEQGIKTNTREKFTRVKVFLDILIGKQPKFLGEPIDIK